MKKVSVIIPCFNATKYLPKCFMSLVQQTIGIDQIELIFVDDASTDCGATWNMLQEFERAYPENIIIIRLEENMRQGGARNVALQYVTGEYIAFVDADDFVANEFLADTYKIAVDTDADIVQFDHFYYKETIGPVYSGRNKDFEIMELDSEVKRKKLLLSEKITCGCWNKLYKSSMVKAADVKFAEHVIYEEPLFVYPLLFFANRITIFPKAFYYYRQNDNGTMRNDMKQKSTIKMHAEVQLSVWNFMKQTPFFYPFYEEIKLYFLHTYLYETLCFYNFRNYQISFTDYKEMESVVKKEIPDYDESPYADIISQQMILYKEIKHGVTQQWLTAYLENQNKLY